MPSKSPSIDSAVTRFDRCKCCRPHRTDLPNHSIASMHPLPKMRIPPNPLSGTVFHMMCSFDSEWLFLIIASPVNSRLHTHDVDSS